MIRLVSYASYTSMTRKFNSLGFVQHVLVMENQYCMSDKSWWKIAKFVIKSKVVDSLTRELTAKIRHFLSTQNCFKGMEMLLYSWTFWIFDKNRNFSRENWREIVNWCSLQDNTFDLNVPRHNSLNHKSVSEFRNNFEVIFSSNVKTFNWTIHHWRQIPFNFLFKSPKK